MIVCFLMFIFSFNYYFLINHAAKKIIYFQKKARKNGFLDEMLSSYYQI